MKIIRDRRTEIQGRRNVKMGAEIGVSHLQARNAKNCKQLPGFGKRHKMVSPSEPPERTDPAETLILDIWPTEL